jgi:superfamily II helicase
MKNMNFQFNEDYTPNEASLIYDNVLNQVEPGWVHTFDGDIVKKRLVKQIMMVAQSRIENRNVDIINTKILTFADIVCIVSSIALTESYQFPASSTTILIRVIHCIVSSNIRTSEITQYISDIIDKKKYTLN